MRNVAANPISAFSVPALNKRQALFGTSVVHRDLTDNLNKTGLELLISGAGLGMWTLDPQKLKINVCHTAKALFGFCANDIVSLHCILKKINTTSRKSLLYAFEEACAKGALIDVEIELLNESRWLKLSGRLQSQLDESPELFMGTLSEITAQKRLEIWNSDGLAILNHELRSPLTTIKLYVQMVAKLARAANDVHSAELLAKADTQVMAMSRMMEDHLAMSVLKNSKMVLYKETFDMLTLINEICSEIQLKSAHHRFVIEFDSSVSVNADKTKIAQVMINYLNNAVKYADEGSLVTIKCVHDKKNVHVAVTDQGIGISEENQLNLFKRYYRTPGSKVSGNGLGLYLVKEIITLHEGKVGVVSRPQEGATFYFSIPR